MELLLPRLTQAWLAASFGGNHAGVPKEATEKLIQMLNQPKLVSAVTSGKLDL